jgi:SAM-dependent methyltransferase
VTTPRDLARHELVKAIAELRQAARDAALNFDHAAAATYRDEVTAGLADALARLRDDVRDISGNDGLTETLVAQMTEYVQWMQWALWDLPAFATALEPDRTRFRRSVAACGFVYLSFRIVDDMLDRHYLYRDRRSTLLATFTRSHGQGQVSEGLTVLAAFLLCFQGLDELAALIGATGDLATATLRQAIASARRTILGAILERTDDGEWNRERYERLVQLKNVEYWKVLNAAIDPTGASALQPFLTEYYALAQRLNDVQDYSADEARGQPNLVIILRGEREPGNDAAPTLEAAREIIGHHFLRLGERLAALPDRERSAAALKLGESLDEAYRLGLFASVDAPDASASSAGASAAGPAASASLRLAWDSTVEEFVERLGPDVLEEVACAVCGSGEARLLFRKLGFAYRRCVSCSHVFVSPRIRAEVQARLAAELDGLFEDPFLDVQRIQAEYLCRVLRRFARGPRLLDVGFGRGYLLHLAHAYGFQPYGADSSPALLDAMRVVFGRRVAPTRVGTGPLPWSGFDVVVMSHVLEHLCDPHDALTRVRDVLNADGLFYVAVPDIGSLQFRVFGKRWDAISPVVHPQYFTETSLRHLLEQSGWEVISRLEHGPEPAVIATPASRLFRALGGSETGELALLCRPASATGDGRGRTDIEAGT